jgi:RES domain-containing protein
MIIKAWRIVKANYKNKAFTGDGARMYGGRWNSRGVPVIYTAGSLALASIEMVVNLPSPKLLEAFVRIPVWFNSKLVDELSPDDLPANWNSRPVSPHSRALGDKWIKEQRSAVLKVPSVVVPEEFNYLLNPKHPDFKKVEAGKPVVYHLDPRLAK